jgi:hypothetical protein
MVWFKIMIGVTSYKNFGMFTVHLPINKIKNKMYKK